MEVRSSYKYARMSSQKVRQVTRAITGMPVSQALSILDFTPKKAALLVGKVLRSAIANAENNHELDAEDLIVRSAVATPGPMLKRITPRARGSASPILKRMSHITVILGEPPEVPANGKKKHLSAARRNGTAAPTKPNARPQQSVAQAATPAPAAEESAPAAEETAPAVDQSASEPEDAAAESNRAAQ